VAFILHVRPWSGEFVAEVKVTFDASDDYQRFMGRWSRAIGERFLTWLAPPAGGRWLDIGCGTGAFSELILRRCAPNAVVGIDPSSAQVEFARKLLPDATFQIADSMELPFGENEFDVAASALVIHFIPDRAKAFTEMERVLRPGGLVAGYTWKRTAATDFAPYVRMLRGVESVGGEALRSPLVSEGSTDGMHAALAAAGFDAIAVTEIEVNQSFRDFDEYWEVQTLPFSPPGKSVAKLDDAQRARLRDLLRETLPIASDGSITYSATALAGKGQKP
jgi:SAM-dependent methyltransferase